ncbi:inositol polyphosphate kinase, putative [Plasmodium gallinaceum]|uniref:Kinase n=1 Tax=Plasmodium gallinaceum TaxID=5849 RepID=A0A1J1GZ16_PLAGA|nr:inositol polyphosphate kinase, putative [Plasmodium gallinaceum]CRG97551.1 inositol polyphosphate kinase, putative [Plasmodium gallinaceum]
MNVEEYRHQVGGHCKLIKPKDSSKVYKPLIENEYIFYEKLTNFRSSSAESGPLHILKKFIPKFYGVTEIVIESYSDLEDKNLCQYSNNIKNNKEKKNKYKKYIKLNIKEDGKELKEMNEDKSENLENKEGVNNDWIEKSKNEDQNKKNESGKNSDINDKIIEKNNEFDEKNENILNTDNIKKNDNIYKKVRKRKECVPHIVLEDLVYGFKRPCVLDIKMGKRQRKIGASLEKKKRQVEKSFKTTSHSLGFRLCGCQNYNKLSDTLFYKDKYWGRKLSKEKIPWAIRNWFWNGCLLYEELIPLLLEKLHSFFNCIVELRHYRFWSSSLLWVFDGGLNDKKARSNSLDIRMIDFANTIYLQDNPSPDDEYIFGLKNLIDSIQILNNSIHNIYFLPYEITTCFYSDNYNTKGIWENKIFKKSKSVIFEENKKKNKKTVYINFEFLKNTKKKKKKKNNNEIQNISNSDYITIEDLDNYSQKNKSKRKEIQIISNSDYPIREKVNIYSKNRNENNNMNFKSISNNYHKKTIGNIFSNNLNETKIETCENNDITSMQNKNDTNKMIDTQIYDETNKLSHDILKESTTRNLEDDKSMDTINNKYNGKGKIELIIEEQLNKSNKKLYKNEQKEAVEKEHKKVKSFKKEKNNYCKEKKKKNLIKSSNSIIQSSIINSYLEYDNQVVDTNEEKEKDIKNDNLNKNINNIKRSKYNIEVEADYINTNKKYLSNISLAKDYDKQKITSTISSKNNNKKSSINFKYKSDDKIINETIIRTLKIVSKLNKKNNEKIENYSDTNSNSENNIDIKKYIGDYSVICQKNNKKDNDENIYINTLNDKYKNKSIFNHINNKIDVMNCKNNENKKYYVDDKDTPSIVETNYVEYKKNVEEIKENDKGNYFISFKNTKYKKDKDYKYVYNLLKNNIKKENTVNYIIKNNDIKKKIMYMSILNKNINLKVLINQIIKMEIEKKKKEENYLFIKNKRNINLKNLCMSNFSDSNKDIIEIQNKIKKMKLKKNILNKNFNNMQYEWSFKNNRYFLKYLNYNSDSLLVSKSIERYDKKQKPKKANNIYKRCSSCTDILLSIKKGKKKKNKKNKIRKLLLRKLNIFSNLKSNIKINKKKIFTNNIDNKLDLIHLNEKLKNNLYHNFSDEFNVFNSEYKSNFYFNDITHHERKDSIKKKYFVKEMKGKNLIVPLTETNENYKYLRRSLSEPNFYKFNHFRCVNNDFYDNKINYNNLIKNRLDKLAKVPIYNQIYGFTSNSSYTYSSDYSF